MGVWQAPRDIESSAPLAAAVVGTGIAALTVVGSRDFALDDAWIHMAYAKSLRLGEGLSYNPGDWELGFSSPLWVLLLAVWPTGANPVFATKLLGALLHGLTAYLAATLVHGLARERATTERPVPVLSLVLLAGALVATAPVLVHSATSGMEVPLAAAALLGTAVTIVAGRPRSSFLITGFAVWARPECLPFVLGFGGPLGWFSRPGSARRRACLAALGGAIVFMTVWMIYCWIRSGQPWPNTQIIKGSGGGADGLRYLLEEVLPWEPWLVSLTGVVLLVAALVREARERRPEVLSLVGSALATWLAIAVTRPLHPGVLFYESRYFAPFSAVFALTLPLGLVGMRRWPGLALIVPVTIATGLQLAELGEQRRRQEHDTATLHSQVARHVADHLPAGAVIAVEGAGALRALTPRSMTIVDLVGLNDYRAARLHSDRMGKTCHFIARRPTHLVIPPPWLAAYGGAFQVETLATFADPDYHQVYPPQARSVRIYRVTGIDPAWRQRCENAGGGHRSKPETPPRAVLPSPT